ncbi:hypothetical protein [Nonomuraea sp. NPDC049758]|uniref:hypothetical protein n=1 Tax=Nonomuraea sp. NPDC049758 TaxID=3154360 RepID=UPI003446B8BC
MTGPVEEPEQVRLVRTADPADLRFGFPGLSFRRPAAGRILVRTVPEREGLIVVTFAAQHIVEQAFFESAGAGLPDPVEVGHLILSALGGWLDALGSWDPRPAITDVSQWRHRAAVGRDHYVRVLYSGYLCPFGHRADLVKVTERKFDPDRPEHPAYLAQRIFITCREPVRDFPPAATTTANGSTPCSRSGGSS